MSGLPPDPWASFPVDPRDPANAVIRASDRDREVVAGVFGTAYAEGRLDRDELDERTTTLATCKTLGQLPPLLVDLVPTTRSPAVRGALVLATPVDIERMAREEYAADRRRAVSGFLSSSLISWVVWLVVTGGGDAFPWPAIVTVVTFLNVVRTVSHRDDRIRREVARLEKKQRRQLKAPETPMGND